jgi:ribulose-5-phosphate 4-epimerase/fuculose-1-phosphate aldolase|tara:strand:+ start:1389 stop:2036 length:648 start_codon:yes stop_codon:yes gene_type:complete
MKDSSLKELMCDLGRSMFDRGLTHGSTGNISARNEDGDILVTPTGSSFGRLTPEDIVTVTTSGQIIGKKNPTKELFLHKAFYENKESNTGAVFHLHSTYSVAYSMLPDLDEDNVFPALTPYSIMLLGRVKLIPFFVPGDMALGEAIKGVVGKSSAVLLANHGPVVAGKNLEAAANAIEELENTAKLALILSGAKPLLLSNTNITDVINKFKIKWD